MSGLCGNFLIKHCSYIGIKGVVYVDAFQCTIIIVGQLVVLGVGISKIGSASDVWDISWEWNRIQVRFYDIAVSAP